MNDISNTISESLKEERESFVTGYNGTTSQEVFMILLSGPLGMIIHLTLGTILRNRFDSRLQLFLEYLMVIVPMCICETRLLYPTIYYMMSLCAICIPYLITTYNTTNTNKEYISWYRALITLYTIIAILAVDFHIFPRRFIKAETHGYSLMDLGAASCIISSAIVSFYAKHGHVLRTKRNYSIILLFIIGVIRTVVLLYINYQGHDSEYGVHWNFFLTLFILNSMSVPLRRLFNGAGRIMNVTVLVMISIVYQTLLSWKLHDFILYAPRTCHIDELSWGYLTLCNFFFANREGIIGCIGYLILHFFAEEIAFICIWSNEKSPNNTKSKLIIISLLLWSIHLFIISNTSIPISRRSINVPFIIWALAMNMTLLSILYFIHVFNIQNQQSNTSFHILSSVNKNSFIVFMVANLCTGLINLCIDTLRVNDLLACCIISCYVAFLVGISLWITKFRK